MEIMLPLPPRIRIMRRIKKNMRQKSRRMKNMMKRKKSPRILSEILMTKEVDAHILQRNKIQKLKILEVKAKVDMAEVTDHQKEEDMVEVMDQRKVDTEVVMDQREVDTEVVMDQREVDTVEVMDQRKVDMEVAMDLRKVVMEVAMDPKKAVMVVVINTDHQIEAKASSAEDQAWAAVHQRERADTITGQVATLMRKYFHLHPLSLTQNSSRKLEKEPSKSSWQRR